MVQPYPGTGFVWGLRMSLQREAEAARRRRSDIAAELRTLNQALRQHDMTLNIRSLTHTMNAASVCKLVPRKHLHTAMMLYHTNGQGEELCRQYLLRLCPKSRLSPADIPHVVGIIQGIPKETSVDLVNEVSWWSRRKHDAQKYVAEHNLHQWIQQENDVCGLAPTTRRVCSAMSGASSDYILPNGMPPLSACTPISNRMKQWTRRWAKRFHLRRGCLGSGAGTSKSEIAAKAPPK